MKKTVLLFLVATIFVALFAFGTLTDEKECFAAEEILPDDTHIVISEEIYGDALAGALTLQNLVRDIFGKVVPIKSDADAQDTYEICIGETNRTGTAVVGKPDGSYRIKTYPGGIELIGQGRRGTVYAVYEFLRMFGGCEWYTSSLRTNADYIAMPRETDVEYTAYFEYTDTDWLSPRDDEYSAAHGLNGGTYRDISLTEGGTVPYLGSFCHSLTTYFCSADRYFDEHPEYFALVNGKRQKTQLCLTNPDVAELVTNEVLELLQKENDPCSPLQIVSITQNDNQEYCQCEDCKKLDEKNHSHAGTMITFANKIACAVADSGYDNVAIDTFAYQYTRACPTEVKPLPNVIVRLCTIECCFSHTLDDETCEENRLLMKDLSDWKNICNRLYIWDYATNYAYTCGFFPDFGVLQKNMQVLYENNVKGVYVEGNYYMGNCNCEFGELRAYLLACLLQNPYCDIEKETDAFLQAYYGLGAPQIKEFLNMTIENASRRHVHINERMKNSLDFSDEEIAAIDALWAAAKDCYKNAEDMPSVNILSHIERSETSWIYWKACCDKGEFGTKRKYAARKDLLDRLNRFGVVQTSEGSVEGKKDIFLMFFPVELWSVKDMGSPVFYYGLIVFAVALLIGVFLTVSGIRRKDIASILSLPMTTLTLVGCLLYLYYFLLWSDLIFYFLSAIAVSILFAVRSMLLGGKIKAKKRTKKQSIIAFVLTFVLYFGIQLGLSFLFNYPVFDTKKPFVAASIVLIMQGVTNILLQLTAFLCHSRANTSKGGKNAVKKTDPPRCICDEDMVK